MLNQIFWELLVIKNIYTVSGVEKYIAFPVYLNQTDK